MQTILLPDCFTANLILRHVKWKRENRISLLLPIKVIWTFMRLNEIYRMVVKLISALSFAFLRCNKVLRLQWVTNGQKIIWRLCLTCIESALSISPLKRLANSTDNLVFPVPVLPSITIRGTFLNISLFSFILHENFFCTWKNVIKILCTVNPLNETARTSCYITIHSILLFN